MQQRMNSQDKFARVAQTLAKFHREAQRQFDEDGFPLIYQLGKVTVVGDETVQKNSDGLYETGYYITSVQRHYPEHTVFGEHDSAVSFIIARQRKKRHLSEQIHTNDRMVAKYKFDQQNFMRLAASALKKRDIFTAELYKLRLEESLRLYKQHRSQLDQLCVEAKYKHKQSG